jgi:surfeit locus 1 family protein
VSSVHGRLRTGLAVPALFVLGAVVTCLALGSWQVQRKAWKEALITSLRQRLAAAPAVLPSRERWPELDPARDEFRRVTTSLTFIPGADALVYAGAAFAREDWGGAGYWIFSLARIARGGMVVVNRGAVPENRKNFSTPTGEGTTDITGVMRWPERRGMFTPKDDPTRNLWFLRDHLAIAAAKGWGEVAPFFIEMESPQPSGGLPAPVHTTAELRNEHLQYAITWYALAGVLVVLFGFWLKSRAAPP